MKLYTEEEFEKMKQLKKDLEKTGEGERFTVKRIQIRLRCGTERATRIFNDLRNEEVRNDTEV